VVFRCDLIGAHPHPIVPDSDVLHGYSATGNSRLSPTGAGRNFDMLVQDCRAHVTASRSRGGSAHQRRPLVSWKLYYFQRLPAFRFRTLEREQMIALVDTQVVEVRPADGLPVGEIPWRSRPQSGVGSRSCGRGPRASRAADRTVRSIGSIAGEYRRAHIRYA